MFTQSLGTSLAEITRGMPSWGALCRLVIPGPGANMSYLPPWAPTSGGGHYPPHMLSPHANSPHSPQTSHSTTQPNSSGSVYQNLSPVVKSVAPACVSVTQSNNAPKSSTVPSSGSASSPTSAPPSVPPSASSLSIGDHYEPQGFQRPNTPPLKRPDLIENLKTENTMSDHPPSEMLLALAGPSSLDLKSPRKYVRRSPGKYPTPEQLPSPVMFSYQGRGRPRKNWTHATGLPTMIPVTHPPMHSGSADDQDDEENKPFKCNICGKGFKLKGGLMQHERTHSTDRPYVCPDCGKLFRQPTHLQQHIRIHTGDKPYDCAFCDKSFRQRTILNQHLRIHTGEKPYVCMECGKQFRQKAILDQHFRTHLGEKPYACPHPSCRKHFREMASLISHMQCHKDVTDPRAVLQQAKRLIKEEQNDDVKLENPVHAREHVEAPDRRLGQERVPQDRELGPDRVLGQEGMEQSRIGQERGMGQDAISQDRSQGHDHRENVSSNSEQGGYQGNGEQVRHDHRPFPPQSASNNSSAHKSPHSLPHSNTDQQNENSSTPSHSQPPPISPNMMPTPQMAMANLIPYPHSIFPAASYMMPPPDPRQYHPQNQGQHPSRPNQ
ncbi:uncharacterized protein [Cherax quadricarinatus]|uniref:uncharacterized protein isoform X1 n=1 Tax=Cherax quadricarinatus TaxID=27406 RepID=UPI0023791DC9|nr:zinc finger protein 362-like isoform X1 [Cherax quadricarinatus]